MEKQNTNVRAANSEFAGLWPRFLALFFDLCVFCALFFPITRIVKGAWIMGIRDHRWHSKFMAFDPICGIFLGIMFIYFVLLEGFFGATIGKFMAGIRVIDLDGRKPGLARSFVRNIFRLADGLPAFNLLGVYLIWSSPERTSMGDRIAQTRVIINIEKQSRRP
jgi:uncharacterized RDD family membrane protein YckC